MPEDLADAKWLSEIRHGNKALINSKTARHLKIKNGDTIELQSETGVLTVKAHVSQGVHPSVIAICKGVGHWEYGDVAQARKFDSKDPDTALIWWSEVKEGVNPKFLTASISDPIGKGAALMDTKVKIRKV
jgi:anaerobic selenocysteine-containing dehydrogenase